MLVGNKVIIFTQWWLVCPLSGNYAASYLCLIDWLIACLLSERLEAQEGSQYRDSDGLRRNEQPRLHRDLCTRCDRSGRGVPADPHWYTSFTPSIALAATNSDLTMPPLTNTCRCCFFLLYRNIPPDEPQDTCWPSIYKWRSALHFIRPKHITN